MKRLDVEFKKWNVYFKVPTHSDEGDQGRELQIKEKDSFSTLTDDCSGVEYIYA